MKPRFAFEFGLPFTLTARPSSTYTCTAHHDVQPWQADDTHLPPSSAFAAFSDGASAKARSVGPANAAAAAVAAVAWTNPRRVMLVFILCSSFPRCV